MSNVADELREYLRTHAPNDGDFWVLGDTTIGELLAIADNIDADHERRMAETTQVFTSVERQ